MLLSKYVIHLVMQCFSFRKIVKRGCFLILVMSVWPFHEQRGGKQICSLWCLGGIICMVRARQDTSRCTQQDSRALRLLGEHRCHLTTEMAMLYAAKLFCLLDLSFRSLRHTYSPFIVTGGEKA